MIDARLKPDIETLNEQVNKYWLSEKIGDNYYKCTMYSDYTDELEMKHIVNIAEKGQEAFDDIITEIINYNSDYYFTELINNIKDVLGRELIDEEYSWLYEHIIWDYEEHNFLKQKVKVNIMVASPECRNEDFVCDNILNYYSEIGYSNGYKDKIPDESCLLWLARQYKMVGKFREAVRAERKSDKEISYNDGFKSTFINSCMQELYNISSHMSCLVFLITMTVEELIDWVETKDTCKGIKVPKKTMCGLFDPWYGGGSVLEIQLPKELTIPTEMIWDLVPDGSKKHGYDVDEVYGLCGNAWDSTVKILK